MDTTVERHGALHIMVPNAGVGWPAPLLSMDLAAWRAVTSVNLDGVFLSIRYAAPAIIAAGEAPSSPSPRSPRPPALR